MNERLQTALKKLRLSGLSETLDVRVQEAASHKLTHEEFLELILQDELAIRHDRLIARRIKAASFRDLKPLDDFDFSFNPKINKKHIFDLATCRFIRETEDVLWLGPPRSVPPRDRPPPDRALQRQPPQTSTELPARQGKCQCPLRQVRPGVASILDVRQEPGL